MSDSVCIDQLEILIIKNQQTLQFINRYCCATASSNLSKAALIPFLIFVAHPGRKVCGENVFTYFSWNTNMFWQPGSTNIMESALCVARGYKYYQGAATARNRLVVT